MCFKLGHLTLTLANRRVGYSRIFLNGRIPASRIDFTKMFSQKTDNVQEKLMVSYDVKDLFDNVTKRFDKFDDKVDKLKDLVNQVDKQLVELRGDVKKDLTELRGDVKKDLTELRGDVKKDLTELRGDVKKDLTELRGDVKKDLTEIRGDVKNIYIIVAISLSVICAAIINSWIRSLSDSAKAGRSDTPITTSDSSSSVGYKKGTGFVMKAFNDDLFDSLYFLF
ncbi:unnamed protein product [Meloidogyne enterolobii]|uniref:Uncharacterized protein n=1 Tax=Meloidogyne enterolobii TaxID=390850 RepID=A0ACB1A4A5_MELEN